MKITFKQHRQETGLASIGAGPRGWEIRLDGEGVGHIYASGGGTRHTFRGWYFVIAANKERGILHINTCNNPIQDVIALKKTAKQYLLRSLAKVTA